MKLIGRNAPAKTEYFIGLEIGSTSAVYEYYLKTPCSYFRNSNSMVSFDCINRFNPFILLDFDWDTIISKVLIF